MSSRPASRGRGAWLAWPVMVALAVSSCHSGDGAGTEVPPGGAGGAQDAAADPVVESSPDATDVGEDAATEAEAGDGADAVGDELAKDGVTCGAAVCTGTQVCCAYASELTCSEPAACTGDFQAACDGAEDCSGGVCCGGPTSKSTECKPATCDPLLILCKTQYECGCGVNCCPFTVMGWTGSFCSAAPCL
jgi:hypothetical protein